MHAPEVECISKGKVVKRYEFGVKASIATTNKSNFVVGGIAVPGSPYDGHTLKSALEQVWCLTGAAIEPVIGHLKADGLMGRNHLKGTEGDQVNVLLSCAGHNLRLILNRLRLFCLEAAMRLLAWLRRYPAPHGLSWLPATSMAA